MHIRGKSTLLGFDSSIIFPEDKKGESKEREVKKREALNGAQKNVIEGTISFYLDEFKELSKRTPKIKPSEAIAGLKAMISNEEMSKEEKAFFSAKEMLVNIEFIQRIINHPCPQNRADSYPYVEQEEGWCMFHLPTEDCNRLFDIEKTTMQWRQDKKINAVIYKNGKKIEKPEIVCVYLNEARTRVLRTRKPFDPTKVKSNTIVVVEENDNLTVNFMVNEGCQRRSLAKSEVKEIIAMLPKKGKRSTNVALINAITLKYKLPQNDFVGKERPGLLSLTSLDDAHTPPVTKEAVVDYIHSLIHLTIQTVIENEFDEVFDPSSLSLSPSFVTFCRRRTRFSERPLSAGSHFGNRLFSRRPMEPHRIDSFEDKLSDVLRVYSAPKEDPRIQALSRLQAHGLRPEHFIGKAWFNDENHVAALVYLMTGRGADNMTAEAAMQELDGLTDSQASAISKGLLRVDVVGLNLAQVNALASLHSRGLTREHFLNQDWFDSSEHMKALIYLMTKRGPENMTADTAMETIKELSLFQLIDIAEGRPLPSTFNMR